MVSLVSPQVSLATKLPRYGFDGWTVRWGKELAARKELQSMAQHPSGNQIPQKSILRPVLFSVLTADRDSRMEGTPAGDTKLSSWFCWRDVMPSRGTWQAWGTQPCSPCAEQGLIRPSARPSTWARTIPSISTDCGLNGLKTGYRGWLWDSGKVKTG